MPEVIKHGKTPEKRLVGTEIACKVCGCQYRILPGDAVSIWRGLTGAYFYRVTCPECGTAERLRVPDAADQER